MMVREREKQREMVSVHLTKSTFGRVFGHVFGLWSCLMTIFNQTNQIFGVSLAVVKEYMHVSFSHLVFS